MMIDASRPSPDGTPSSPQMLAIAPKRAVSANARQEQFITVELALHALRRWWKGATIFGLVLAATVASALYLMFEPVFQAAAWLQIEDRSPYVAFPMTNDAGQRFVQTQVEIIRSPLVTRPVLSQPEIQNLRDLKGQLSPSQWLARNIQVRSVGGSELFTVSWQGPDPKGAAAIVNAVVDTYMQRRKSDEAERTQKIIELVGQENDNQRAKVGQLQEQVRDLTKEVTGKDPFAAKTTPEISGPSQVIASLQSRLTEAQVQKVFLEAEVKAYQESTGPAAISEGEIERAVAQNSAIQARAAQLEGQRAALRRLEGTLAKGAQDPYYQEKAAAVKQEEEILQQTRTDLAKQIRAEMERTQIAQSQDKLNAIKSELKSVQLTEDLLKERLEDARKNITASSVGSVELMFLQSELGREEDVFQRIASRLIALKTEQRAPERVSLLQRAEVPTDPVVSTPYKKMALGGGAAFVAPFALAVLLERLLRRVNDAKQLKEYSQLPVVGEIAQLPLRARGPHHSSSSRVREDLQLFQESIDSLRTTLVTLDALREMQVLAVTSAANNEGKTSVAVQLAVSIARASGEKTLLIDGDMRSPDVHRVLDTTSEPGLAELLAHECTLDDPVIVNWSSHVDVLPAGKLANSPHRLLGNGAFHDLLDQLRTHYRYIVIDTPPVLAASESIILSRAADACLLCAMRDVSRLDQVSDMHVRLLAAGANPVGVVLNGVPVRQYGYRYGRYAYSVS